MPQGQFYPGAVLCEALEVHDALITYNKGLDSNTAPVTFPGLNGSGTAVTNTLGINVFSYITGGTVSAITVVAGGGGAALSGSTLASLGANPGLVFVPAGAALTITYTSAPTVVWQPM
jgi:hypothetical protein